MERKKVAYSALGPDRKKSSGLMPRRLWRNVVEGSFYYC